MLGEKGVYALSPELGNQEHGSEYFFIKSNHVLKQVLTQNYGWVERAFARLLPMIVVKEKHAMLLSEHESTVEVETVLSL